MKADIEDYLGIKFRNFFPPFEFDNKLKLNNMYNVWNWVDCERVSYDVASRGKEVPAKAPKGKDVAAPALDYVDIPHSQIRKVHFLIQKKK